MPMTTLNIGAVTSDRKPMPQARQAQQQDRCPRCKRAGTRIDGGGFGGCELWICGYCAYEFPPDA